MLLRLFRLLGVEAILKHPQVLFSSIHPDKGHSWKAAKRFTKSCLAVQFEMCISLPANYIESSSTWPDFVSLEQVFLSLAWKYPNVAQSIHRQEFPIRFSSRQIRSSRGQMDLCSSWYQYNSMQLFISISNGRMLKSAIQSNTALDPNISVLLHTWWIDYWVWREKVLKHPWIDHKILAEKLIRYSQSASSLDSL